MEKSDFLRSAPDYYMYAIGNCLNERGFITANDIRRLFVDGNRSQLLVHIDLFNKVIGSMASEKLIEVIEDDFGPTLYRATEDLEAAFDVFAELGRQPFQKRVLLKVSDSWLHAAIAKLNQLYGDLGVSRRDISNPDADWEPLPLERSDPDVEAAAKSLSETIEIVEQDNGYAANLPEERAYVLASLRNSAERLSEGEMSVGFLRKHTFEPLLALVRRFKTAAIGVAASATAAAFIALLKDAELGFVKEALKKMFGL